MNAEQIQNILNDIEGYISSDETSARFLHQELWPCYAEYDYSDECYIAHDGVESARFDSLTDAVDWMIQSIDQALSTELDNIAGKDDDDNSDDDDDGDGIFFRPSKPVEAVLTTDEVSRYYGISQQAVRQACEKGLVEARKAGSWIISKEAAYARWGNVTIITSSKPLNIAAEDSDVLFESGSYSTVRNGWIYRYVLMTARSGHNDPFSLPSGAVLHYRHGSSEYPGKAWIE